MAERPPNPPLSPVVRSGGRLIPLEELERQIIEMDRLGTWHLAQALALQKGFDDGTVDEDKYRTNQLNRHLQFAGAMLSGGSARIGTYRFIKEARDGKLGPRGDHDQYGAAHGRGGDPQRVAR